MSNLKSCKECGNQIALQVDTCPKCGSAQGSGIIINLVCGIIFIYLVYFMFTF